jgi:hypothetical protein
MKVLSAFALTPAAIIREAKLCRHSCNVTRSWAAAFHARSAARVTAPGWNGTVAVRTNTSSSSSPLASTRWSTRWSRSTAAIGTRRRPLVDFGAIGPATASQPLRTWITPTARSTSHQRSAINSPRRRPAYIPHAQRARCSRGRAAMSAVASTVSLDAGGQVDAGGGFGKARPAERERVDRGRRWLVIQWSKARDEDLDALGRSLTPAVGHAEARPMRPWGGQGHEVLVA